MLELRWLQVPETTTKPPSLQYRIHQPVVDVGGHLCPGEWTDWTDVPTVVGEPSDTASPSAPVAQGGGEVDDESADASVWTLIALMERVGGERDSGEEGSFITMTLDQVYALEALLTARGHDPGWVDTAPPSAPVGVDAQTFEAALTEYVEDYEFHGEDESGRDGVYTPNERERLLIEDAIRGWEPPKALAQQPAADNVPQDAGRVAVHFLARIFAAQEIGTDGEYRGWKISGKGSLNEVVAEARAWLAGQQTAAVDWRAQFIDQVAAYLRAAGMKIEQARIHAETAARRAEIHAQAAQQEHPDG